MINQKRHNTILYLHSIWLRENGYKNWKACERASKEVKRGVSISTNCKAR